MQEYAHNTYAYVRTKSPAAELCVCASTKDGDLTQASKVSVHIVCTCIRTKALVDELGVHTDHRRGHDGKDQSAVAQTLRLLQFLEHPLLLPMHALLHRTFAISRPRVPCAFSSDCIVIISAFF
jgi:hypothetical protein